MQKERQLQYHSFVIPNKIMNLYNYQYRYKTISEKLLENFIMDASC